MTVQKSKLLISTLLVSAACSSQAENSLGASVGPGDVDYTTNPKNPKNLMIIYRQTFIMTTIYMTASF